MICLSCDHVPGYPDGLQKAQNGLAAGGHGENGKPGLPGYNAGNLFIYANEINQNEDNEFIMSSGKGGPGQDGEF